MEEMWGFGIDDCVDVMGDVKEPERGRENEVKKKG